MGYNYDNEFWETGEWKMEMNNEEIEWTLKKKHVKVRDKNNKNKQTKTYVTLKQQKQNIKNKNNTWNNIGIIKSK